MAIEKDIVISLPDGDTDAIVLQPAGNGPWPGVLYLTDIGGIRAAQRQAAARLSDEGYLVLLPNVFYRVAKPPIMDVAKIRSHPEQFMQRVRELAAPLTPDAQERDAKGYVHYLASLEGVRDGSKLGVVGFCFCGGMAMRTAAVCPEQVVAAASFHGGNLYEDKPSSPHLLLPKIKARLLFGHGVEDRSMPVEAIALFEEALKKWGGAYESETYAGALHGWTTTDHPAFQAEQAARAYAKLTRLFAETMT